MELRHLRYFVAVAEELHFGRAAARLGIAQPPLSVQIRNLERELGVELLHRGKRRITDLTPAGRMFLEEARGLLERAARMTLRARRAQAGQLGRLTVAVAPLAAYTVLPRILRQFHARFPDVDLTVREAMGGDLVWGIEQGDIDAGLLVANFESRVLQMRTLLSMPLRAIVPETHRLARATTVRLRDLADEPFIVFPRGAGSGFRQTIMDVCQAGGFIPHVAHEVNQVRTLVMMVSAGYGVSLVPSALGTAMPAMLESMPMLRARSVVSLGLRPSSSVSLCAAWKAADDSPALAGFLAIVGAVQPALRKLATL